MPPNPKYKYDYVNQSEDEEETTKTSRFSTAISKEIRRAVLWNDVNRHSRSGKFLKWNEDLDTIWSELSADLKDKEYEEKKAKVIDFDKRIVDVGEIMDTVPYFEEVTTQMKCNRAKHYKILREKEEFLRRLENDLGKGTEWRDEEEDEY